MTSQTRFKRLVPFMVAACLAVVAIGALIYEQFGSAAEQTASPVAPIARQRVSLVNGVNIVTLSAATQRQSGLQVETLPLTNHHAQTTAYASVLDLQPLLDLRARYETARAEADTAVAAITASRGEFERSKLLYQDNQNISLKAYQAAQAAYLSDQARVAAARRAIEAIRTAGRQQFGEPLGHWALDLQSSRFARLRDRQEVLLRVSLPAGSPAKAPATIQIAASDNVRLTAHLVSPSPRIDPDIEGAAFIYRTAASMATGSRVAAYLATSDASTRGVLVPATAIVWHGGQAWAYVQSSPDRFSRLPVAQSEPVDGGFFVSHGIKAGDSVVVSGAQLLLSEEMRPPPNSSSCKDPECD